MQTQGRRLKNDIDMVQRPVFGERLLGVLMKGNAEDRAAAVQIAEFCAKKEEMFREKLCRMSAETRDCLCDEMFEAEYSALVDALRGVPAKILHERLMGDWYLWKNPVFDHVAKRVAESDAFDSRPCEAEEGLYRCKKCASTRTFSFGKQTRGLDEGTTVFVKCAKCSCSWVIGG